jgi:multicomponent Na+:H+ antiporter subunit D
MQLGWMAPLILLLTSLVPAVVIFLLPAGQRRLRNEVNLAGAAAKVAVVMLMLWGVYQGEDYRLFFELGPGLSFILQIDALALLFVTLSAVLWLLTTIYAIAYLSGDAEQRRFFGFFSLCVMATVGIALAGNPLTFFFFYELLTLSTFPLVAHLGDRGSLAAGRTYLRYTLFGSAVLLLGIVWLEAVAGPANFLVREPAMLRLAETEPLTLQLIFALLVGGLAVKAAVIPLHGWLPAAMVAPAPVSALLHAVAVVKAGAFGIVRVIFDLYGIELTASLGLGAPLTVAASFTIIVGSLIALQQVEIKRRLAFSTVSQISYILLGASLLSPLALIGCLAHIVHQGLMKVTLFFCAGAFDQTLGVHRVDEMDGIGRRMPLTMLAFSAGALGMIGVPPIAGFVSKWYLGLGALEAGEPWVLAVLAASTLLNALYFLPLVYRGWFGAPKAEWPRVAGRQLEAPLWLVAPGVATAAFAIAAGLFAAFPWSPLDWATLIVERQYAGAP